MAKVEIYTRPMCIFCSRAKSLLSSKGVDFEEYNVWTSLERARERTERSGGSTLAPQIFIDDRHIGGCDQLIELERAGKLDALLKNEDVKE